MTNVLVINNTRFIIGFCRRAGRAGTFAALKISFIKHLCMTHYPIAKLVVLWATLFLLPRLSAQNFTISGTIKDKNTGETLIGATILLPDLPARGTVWFLFPHRTGW
jgi:hypothetical protein